MAAINLTKKEARKIFGNLNLTNKSNIQIQKQETHKNQRRGEMRNKLSDLNNYLFEQLERLNDDDLGEEEFSREIERSKAVTDVANAIINNANVALKGAKFLEEQGFDIYNNDAIKLLGGDNGDNT